MISSIIFPYFKYFYTAFHIHLVTHHNNNIEPIKNTKPKN